MDEKLMYRGASKIPNRKSFRGNIKWFTTNKEYADSFAKYNILYANGLDASMTYTVDIDTDNLKLYDCGVTDFPLYNIMRPMKPYQISTFMEEMVKGLRIDENTLKTLVNKVVEEYTNKGFTDREIFKLKLWNVVKTDTFASLVKSRGYDGVITNEFGNECYGIFNDKNIKILDEELFRTENGDIFCTDSPYQARDYLLSKDYPIRGLTNGEFYLLGNADYLIHRDIFKVARENGIEIKEFEDECDFLYIPKDDIDLWDYDEDFDQVFTFDLGNRSVRVIAKYIDFTEYELYDLLVKKFGEPKYETIEDYAISDEDFGESLKEAIIIRDKRKLFEETNDPMNDPIDDPDDISTFEGPEVEEDDTYEDEDLIKNEEILSTLYKYTHIKNKDSEDASYCFLEEICNIYGLDEDEVKNIALSNGYKLMRVFPNENVDGGILIADKNCSSQHIKTDYLKFYGVEAEVEEYKGE